MIVQFNPAVPSEPSPHGAPPVIVLPLNYANNFALSYKH